MAPAPSNARASKVRLVPVLAAAVFIPACTSPQGNVDDILIVSEVEMAPPVASVRVGGTVQLTATPKTASGIVLSGRTVTWSSSDPSIATVSATGLVTAVQAGGPVTISAEAEGVSGESEITVLALPVSRVTVTPPEVNLALGTSTQLTATAYDPDDGTMPGAAFAWTSSNPAVADVTTTGIVVAVAKGTATITATADQVSGSATVAVLEPAPSQDPPVLSITTQPSSAAQSGVPLARQPVIQVRTSDGDAISGITVTVAIASGGGTLAGALTASSDANGMASYANLAITGLEGDRTLRFTAPGATPVVSDPIALEPGPASRLTITVQPSSVALRSVRFLRQPVIQLRDQAGNPIGQAGVPVTASIASGQANAKLEGTTTVSTNGSGTASFTNLSINRGGTFTLLFRSGTLQPATSDPIAIP